MEGFSGAGRKLESGGGGGTIQGNQKTEVEKNREADPSLGSSIILEKYSTLIFTRAVDNS